MLGLAPLAPALGTPTSGQLGIEPRRLMAGVITVAMISDGRGSSDGGQAIQTGERS